MIIRTTNDISILIKEERKRQNLTQVELAQLTNVGVRFLSDLENGKKTCEIEKVLKVLNGLGIRLTLKNGSLG